MEKRRVAHDAFCLLNRRQECRRSQGDGRCGNPGRRSPVGALALGYDVAALQAGGAVRVGMGMRGSGVRGQAKRDTAFPQGDKRQRGPAANRRKHFKKPFSGLCCKSFIR